MHVSSSFVTARKYAGDIVILYFRIREAPNVVIVTMSLVIYVFRERIQSTQGGSVSHTRGTFLSSLGSCDTSQVSAATRQTLRRNSSHRTSRRLCECNERMTRERSERGLGDTTLVLCALGFQLVR